MLCTALTSNGKAGFSVEAEVYTETATFAKAMLILRNDKGTKLCFY